jgi:hypothetical protein
MLQVADTLNKTRDEILCADVDAHLRRLEQGLSSLRLLVRAMSHGNAAWNQDALLFTIDAMDQPIEAIDDLMEAAGGGGSKRCFDRGSFCKAITAVTAPAANPELVALVRKLNDAISRSNQNKADAAAAGDDKRVVELNGIDEAIGAERSDIEQAILEFPSGSIGDLVVLAKLAEHQHFYGQMSDDTPITLADSILRIFAGRPFIEPAEGGCADRPIII